VYIGVCYGCFNEFYEEEREARRKRGWWGQLPSLKEQLLKSRSQFAAKCQKVRARITNRNYGEMMEIWPVDYAKGKYTKMLRIALW
jgi:hypothetical protein